MANDTDGLLTAQNARIQNLEAGLITQGQGLLALEQTQQQILQQLQTLNMGGLIVPDDFNFQVEVKNNLYSKESETNHNRHKHVIFNAEPNNWTSNSFNRNPFGFKILCNYQVRFNVKLSLFYGIVTAPNQTALTTQEILQIKQYWNETRVKIEISGNTSEGGEGYGTIADNSRTTLMFSSAGNWNYLVQTFFEYETSNNYIPLLFNVFENEEYYKSDQLNIRYRIPPRNISLYIEFENIFEKITN